MKAIELTIGSHLVEAIRIMDERGRRLADQKSIALWETEWVVLRNEIFEALCLPSQEES